MNQRNQDLTIMKMSEWMVTVFFLINFCISCADDVGNKRKMETNSEEKEMIEEKMSFQEQIDALKQMSPILPIEGSFVSQNDNHLPNAPREYRHGFHEGLDFYNGFCGAKIENGTPVVAISDGEIIRADTNYIEIESERREKLLKETHSIGFTPDSTLDVLRGRQVWLDHGSGIVTRYCHLSLIPSGLKGRIRKGEIVGFVGGSGTKSKIPHLHFEVRIGKYYLGKNKNADEIRKLIEEIFER